MKERDFKMYERTIKKEKGRGWTRFFWLRIATSGGLLSTGWFMKCCQVLHKLNTGYVGKKSSVVCSQTVG
jgi:hypothetical protein